MTAPGLRRLVEATSSRGGRLVRSVTHQTSRSNIDSVTARRPQHPARDQDRCGGSVRPRQSSGREARSGQQRADPSTVQARAGDAAPDVEATGISTPPPPERFMSGYGRTRPRIRAVRYRSEREWWNGRHARFRSVCPQGRGGSNPLSRTQGPVAELADAPDSNPGVLRTSRFDPGWGYFADKQDRAPSSDRVAGQWVGKHPGAQIGRGGGVTSTRRLIEAVGLWHAWRNW